MIIEWYERFLEYGNDGGIREIEDRMEDIELN